MKNLKGKTAVVTGAGSGIGRALAQQLAALGVNLALTDINQSGLDDTMGLISDEPIQAKSYQVDVSNRQAVQALADQVIRDLGSVDILINNAGVSSSGPVLDLSYDLLEWTININLWGVIHGVKAFLPHLLTRPEAAVVNVSSVFGLMGIPGQAAYCTSKFAVRGFTESLRQEMFGTPVAVTVVFPGGVRTPIARNSRTDYEVDPEIMEMAHQSFQAMAKTSPEEAALAIIEGIRKKKPRVLIGKDARGMDRLARYAPNGYDRVVRRHTGKKQGPAGTG